MSTRGLLAAVVLSTCLLFATLAYAHPDHLGQALYVDVRSSGVQLDLTLSPGTQVSAEFAQRIDANADGIVSDNEANAVARSIAERMTVRVDGERHMLTAIALEAPSAAILQTGESTLHWTAQTTVPLSPGDHELEITNRYAPMTSVYSVHAFGVQHQTSFRSQARAPGGSSVRLVVHVEGGNLAPTETPARSVPYLAFAPGLVLALALLALGFSWRVRRERAKAQA